VRLFPALSEIFLPMQGAENRTSPCCIAWVSVPSISIVPLRPDHSVGPGVFILQSCVFFVIFVYYNYMDQITTSTIISTASQNTGAFERAKNAVFVLRDSQSNLSRQEEETLGILMDQKLINHLNTSLQEAENEEVESLENILD